MRKNKVQVWLRTKPSQNYTSNYLSIQNDKKTVFLHIPKDEKVGIVNNQVTDWSFTFDGVFHNSSQEDVCNEISDEMLQSALNGYNCTVMCYGQTGAGKTFTLTGATENFNNRGVVPRALTQLFRKIEEDSNNSVTIRVSYLEIYNEQMYDLLSTLDVDSTGNNLVISEDDEGGIVVKGLGCYLAQSEEDALNLLFEGESNRATAAHTLNKRSSRSHCIFTVYLETRSRMQSRSQYSISKIQFVDLAGSERLQKTNSTGKIQQEASYINKSLSFLEQTVIALSDKRRDHVPFRQSKLTHFLKDSIGGTSKTMLIANVWSDVEQMEETISTMRFALRMMKVASEPIENIKQDSTILIKNLRKEISALRQELSMYDALNNRNNISYEPLSEQQKYEIKEQANRFAEGELAELDIINFRQVQGVYEAFKNLLRQQKQFYEEKLKSVAADVASQGSQAASAAGQAATGPGAAVSSPSQGGKGSVGGRREKGSAAHQQQPQTGTTETPSPVKVGDIDRAGGFGVGQGDKGLLEENGGYLQSRKKERKRNAGSVGSRGAPVTKEDSITMEKETTEDKGLNEIPSRSEAFEDYKNEGGAEIFKILNENKDILSNKKKEYSEMAAEINSCKIQIDVTKINLESLKRERECQGPNFTPDGEVIITEDEYKAIENLNLYKKQYREKFEDLKNLKSAIFHCQKMVDLTRQQLLKDFDKWYTDSYLDGDQASKQADAELMKKINYEDPIEKFDAVKHLKYGNGPEEAYNRAKEALTHRHVFGAALNQAQPVRRKPGSPVYADNTHTSFSPKMEFT